MGAAEPVIGQQAAYLLMAGNQPGKITHRGPDLMDHAIFLQLAEHWRHIQRMSLVKRAAEPSCLTPPQVSTARPGSPPGAATAAFDTCSLTGHPTSIGQSPRARGGGHTDHPVTRAATPSRGAR